MKHAADLGIYSDVPFVDRLMRFIDGLLWVLVLNPISGCLLFPIICVLFLFFVSIKLRSLSDSTLFNGLVILILAIVTICLGWVVVKLTPVLERLILGKLVFAEVGGLPRKIFFTSLKLAHAIKYEFNEQDTALLREFGALDRDLTEALLKWNYRKNVYEHLTPPRPDFDAAWATLWNDILNVGTERRTFRDALTSDGVAFSIIPMRLVRSSEVVLPFITTFHVILIYFLARYLDGSSQLVTVIQVGVALSFIFSALWFSYHAYELRQIEFIGVSKALPAELLAQFGARIKQFQDLKVRPTNVTVGKRYLSLVRNYLLTSVWTELLLNMLLAQLVVGGTLLIGRLAFASQFKLLAAWYQRFAIGLILIPFGFLAGYYLSFWILQNFRQIVAPLLASVVGALLPFGLSFILTGNLQLDHLSHQISAALAGVGILFTATISSLIKKKLED